MLLDNNGLHLARPNLTRENTRVIDLDVLCLKGNFLSLSYFNFVMKCWLASTFPNKD